VSKRPLSFIPRGLPKTESALYVGVGEKLFDEMVQDGRMPKPRLINSKKIWDMRQLDTHFDRLPGGDEAELNEWDGAA
jgi:hypothetical protein